MLFWIQLNQMLYPNTLVISKAVQNILLSVFRREYLNDDERSVQQDLACLQWNGRQQDIGIR